MKSNNLAILETNYVTELNNLIDQEYFGSKIREQDLDKQFSQKSTKPLAFSYKIEKNAHQCYIFLSKVKNFIFQPFWGLSGSC